MASHYIKKKLGELLPAVPYVGGGIWAGGVTAEYGSRPALLEAGLDGRPGKEGR